MTYKMNKKQLEHIINLNAEDRYSHLLEKIIDSKEIWSLKNNEGFVSMEDSSKKIKIPFWPHPEYAKLFITESWSDCEPQKIKLNDFLEKWLPGMKKDNIMAIVFPIPSESGITIDPNDLLDDIKDEC